MRKASEHERASTGAGRRLALKSVESDGAARQCRAAERGIPSALRRRIDFHLILQLELALFQGDFFDLFGFRKVMAGGQIVDLLVEVVMLGGELAKLLIGLQKLSLQLFEVCRHLRLL